jgi:phospholipase/carboxylesterase
MPWLLVLMHGVGSNEDDLFGLADFVPAPFHVVSLRAPFVLGPDSYAWFEFSVANPMARAASTPARKRAAARRSCARCRRRAHSSVCRRERTVLGGFSQGGIMALSLLRTRPDLMQGAMVMHGRLLPEVDTLEGPPEALQGKALWVSHGQQDGVIPMASAQRHPRSCEPPPARWR